MQDCRSPGRTTTRSTGLSTDAHSSLRPHSKRGRTRNRIRPRPVEQPLRGVSRNARRREIDISDEVDTRSVLRWISAAVALARPVPPDDASGLLECAVRKHQPGADRADVRVCGSSLPIADATASGTSSTSLFRNNRSSPTRCQGGSVRAMQETPMFAEKSSQRGRRLCDLRSSSGVVGGTVVHQSRPQKATGTCAAMDRRHRSVRSARLKRTIRIERRG